MSVEQLWAPWRMAYIEREPVATSSEGCFICRGLAESEDRKNQIVLRTNHSVVLLNRYPYNNGHLLVAPRMHKNRLDQLSHEEMSDVHESLRFMVGQLEKIMKPEGFNIGVNLGSVAGAGLPGHLHWHIVPRWYGDTNFMPVLANVKVIVQSLDSLYDLLKQSLGNDG